MPTRSKRPPAEAHSGAPHELRSFGRRRGRRLSARQQQLIEAVLPRVAVPAEPLPPPSSGVFAETWLEIGFGGGEHLLWQARTNPGVGLIGCEVFEDGLVKVLSAVEAEGLANLRLSSDDARALLRRLPPASLARVFVLFPDPWPKKKHRKRRLLNRGFLDQLAVAMQPGAELRIATDIGDYLFTMLKAFRCHPAFVWQAAGPRDWRQRPADWPATRYEQKAVREGRRCYFLRFRRR